MQVVEDDQRAELSDGSTAPQAVQPITAVAPSSRSAQMLARWVTWLESRTWPAPWRETCSTSTPAKLAAGDLDRAERRGCTLGVARRRSRVASGFPSR